MQANFTKLLILFCVCISLSATAQAPFYNNYDWEENPAYAKTKFADKDIVGVKNHVVSEFIYNEAGDLEKYFVEHKAFWLNSDEKIEEYNKVYIPIGADSEIIVHKARVINKSGKILVLNDTEFLTATDDETKQSYKYFAFEGLEMGSFIEYFYVEKQSTSYNGTRLSLQHSFDQHDVAFTLLSPRNLFFATKSYNGLPAMVFDTLTPEKNSWSLKLKSIKGLEEEEQATFNANKQFIVYKLDRNTYGNRRDISSYGQASQNLYNFFFKNISEAEKQAVSAFIKENFDPAKDKKSLIRDVENHLKANLFFTEVKSDAHENLVSILANKIADQSGFIKLFAQTFKQLQIPMEIVLTSDRNEIKFDPEFEAYNFLNEYLLYFPEFKSFTHPHELEARLGFPPYELTDTYGLFVKEVTVGSFASGVGEVRYIDAVVAEKTTDNIDAKIVFNPDDLSSLTIDYRREFTGYSASVFQPYLGLISQEQKDEIYQNILDNSLSQNIEVENLKIENEGLNDFGVHPFVLQAKVNTDDFVDKAGNRYIFKIGQLIGLQVEMYEDKLREQTLEADFQRTYFRTLTFDIPEGFQIQNLDDINIDESFSENGKTLMYFKSSYAIEGNTVTVTANEQYNQNIIDLSLYESYRKVINSAADFNKVKLVLTPK
ncbi:MAG: DUF3857 domain-containing protein [Flavobacteriaceae bacterium]|nr:DUF3857 domain-containing protein [Flavobacteriaceae bacterium]